MGRSLLKIILLADVPKLGRKYEVKEVAPGYGRHFLVARGLGLLSTPANLRQIRAIQQKKQTEEQTRLTLLGEAVRSLAGTVVTIEAKVNEKGHLFAGLHAEEISQALKEKNGVDLPPEVIGLATPIKEVGEFTLPLKVGDYQAELKLVVRGH